MKDNYSLNHDCDNEQRDAMKAEKEKGLRSFSNEVLRGASSRT